MQSDQLEFNVRHSSVNGAAISNDVAIIDLHGELSARAGGIDQAFAQARQQNPSIISLNFGGVVISTAPALP
jgi:hypothetical protein